MSNEHYKPKGSVELLNVSVKALQRWGREGILKAHRSLTDRCYYTYDQYLACKGIKNQVSRKNVIYTIVSTATQKDDLNNQVNFFREFANDRGMIVDETIKDLGSELNYNRQKWNHLLEDCMKMK